MFGSDYMKQFGLEFPMQNLDPQGGLFAPNAPTHPEIGSQPLGAGERSPAAPAMAAPQAPHAGPAGGLPEVPGLKLGTGGEGERSPLGSPLALGQGGPEHTAPAAGVESPFGKPQP